MPRGVPANGQRRPRQRPAEAAVTGEPALAPGALYGADEQPQTAEVETAAPDAAPAERELTPEEQRIKELEYQLSLLAGKKDVEPEVEEISLPGAEGNIVIHFLEDGFTALGNVWYRGQELEFEPGSQAYKDTFNRRGQSWLDLRNDEFAQVERWGRIVFRNGPWPGKRYVDAASVSFEKVLSTDGSSVKPPTEEELAAAEKAEARRRRAAPRLAPAV